MNILSKFNKGFTLIELMVVITVIAILSTLALFGISKAQASGRDVARQQIMRGVQTALQRYYGDSGSYPSADWACALYILRVCNYLTVAPKDPAAPNGNDLACGSGGSGVCGSVTCFGWNGPTKGDTGWCGGDGTGAWKAGYSMTVGGSSYSLSLTKESGGVSTFVSPQ